jgi:hypothetical protein
VAVAGDRDLLAGAHGIQEGGQMGLGLEGTDAAHGDNFNQLATSLIGLGRGLSAPGASHERSPGPPAEEAHQAGA